MTQLEYLVALISIIVGLGLTDLAQSFRELLRPGHPVRWDALPLAWSVFTFLFTILLWWNGFGVLKGQEETGSVFLMYLLIFFLLYLCCAFALPDPDWERTSRSSNQRGSSRQKDSSEWGVDLEAFYFSKQHRRWFFGLLIGLVLMLGVANEVRFGEGGIAAGFAVPLAIPIGTDRRWGHWIAVALSTSLVGFFVIKEIVL